MLIDENTKLAGSIASKQTGLGPAMHNAAYEHLGLNYVYLALTVSDCKKAVQAIRALNFAGVAVSKPYKQKVLQYLDTLDPIAKKIGAVNTVTNSNGKLVGYNSDWIGAVHALEEATQIANKNIAVMGAGGAARAIAYGLKQRKARVTIFNRTYSRGNKLAKDFGQKFGGKPEDIPENNNFDIFINATSVGYDDPTANPIPNKNIFHKGNVVLDVVFSPLKTPLLEIARKQGCITIPGYRMLVHQAVFQFEKFTGKTAPFSVMENALKRQLK